MRAGLCCASETMGADGWPAADVARPVTDACEREHTPPMESISAAWQQGLTHTHTQTDGPDLSTEAETHSLSCTNRLQIWKDAIKSQPVLEYFLC